MAILVSILAVNVHAGSITPCVKIAHSTYEAALAGSNYTIVMTFTYPSHGTSTRLGSSQAVARTVFERAIDTAWDDVHGSAIALAANPDQGSSVTCTAKLTLTDASGVTTDASDVATTTVPAYR